MFEWIKDLLVQFWGGLTPVYVVNQYEAGVVLRFGVYAKTVSAGLHMKIPLADKILTHEIVTTTHTLDSQTLMTADGKSVVVTVIVKYHIKDVKPLLLDVWHPVDVLNDTTNRAVREVIASLNSTALNTLDFEDRVTTKVRRQTGKYGFAIEWITCRDLCAMRSIRLISDKVTAPQ